MRKLFVLITILLLSVFIFLGCNGDPSSNEDDDEEEAKLNLRIQNQSAATLFNVVWNGHSFNEGKDINTGGNSQIDDIQEGRSFIFFSIKGAGSDISLRTLAIVSIPDQNLPFIFINNTTIVEVANPSVVLTIESFLKKINNPEGLYLPSHNEILLSINAIGGGITNTRILSYQVMQNLLWQNVISGNENEEIILTRGSKINIEVGYTGPVSSDDVSRVLERVFINFTNANIIVSGGMTFPLPTHLQIQQAIMSLDGAQTTTNVVATNYIVNGSFIFDGYEIDRPHGAIIEITVRYTTIILTQERVRTEVTRIFATAGFNNVTVNAAHW
jgi:hypothetical protein